jgi:hypothetical protein
MMNQCPDEETVKELDTGISLRKMNAVIRFAEHLSAELSSYSNTANTVFITKIVTLPADDGGFPTITVTLHSKDRRCFTLPLLRLNSFRGRDFRENGGATSVHRHLVSDSILLSFFSA